MVYESPTAKSIFQAGEGFWVWEIRGVAALSYTDHKERALRFETDEAREWEPILRRMAECELTRIDLPKENEGISVNTMLAEVSYLFNPLVVEEKLAAKAAKAARKCDDGLSRDHRLN